jgi:hypothetical protein
MPILTPAQVARKAKELLSDRERWITGDTAQDKLGNHVSPNDPSARAFCAIGAVYHVCGISDDLLNDFQRSQSAFADVRKSVSVADKDLRRVEVANKVIEQLGKAAYRITEDQAESMFPCTCSEMSEDDLLYDVCEGCESRYVIDDIVELNDAGYYEQTLDAFEEAYQDFLRAKLAKAS